MNLEKCHLFIHITTLRWINLSLINHLLFNLPSHLLVFFQILHQMIDILNLISFDNDKQTLNEIE